MRFVEINNPHAANSTKIAAKYCSSFFCKFKGLMLQKNLGINEGVLLVEDKNSIVNTSIHMLFMLIDICVVWINSDLVVVDKCLAKKWAPFYFPHKPAMYILECHPGQFENFQINDIISIQNV